MSELININEVVPNPDNPRIIKDGKFKKLVKSLKEFPQMMEKRPIIIDENNMILGGNMRLRAAQSAGMDQVWIDRAEDWTEEQKREFIIKDNVGFGEWDWDIIANEWDSEQLGEWGLDLPGFDNVFGEDDSESVWKIKQDATDGDGIDELVGYNNSSLWYGMPRVVEGITENLIDLPSAEGKRNGTGKGSLQGDGKYSRTIPEEIRRVVRTYMREGDFFLENCCGWSTFGAIAKMHGYSGIGVDIWDKALENSKKQIGLIKNSATVDIIEMDGMGLAFEDSKFDYVYCNPPFMDVELYSGKDNDIADSDPGRYMDKLTMLCAENKRVLKKGGLCTMTIADYRKNGVLVPMYNILTTAGINAGFKIHDMVIAENLGIANILRKKASEKRRTAKNHEYVITFIKQ